MSIQRKMKRERQIQGRKALRQELKDQAVRDFIQQNIDNGCQEYYRLGIQVGKGLVADAAAHLEYIV